ncbi:MAG: flagellar basal body P-ring formation protein FlgA [Burkholderiales bacterium]|nr:MAG: flagellar basal body P-ring formation protein FlgA [Burkholderiales bacterium]
MSDPIRLTSRLRGARPASALASALVLAAVCASASAQSPSHPALAPEQIRAFVERLVPAGAGRVEVQVGALDPRLQLAPCGRAEPYQLPSTRPWGRTLVGVRCLEGATWSVTLPVNVIVRGRALVAGEALAAGSSPSGASLRIEEAELSREPGTPVTDTAQLVGRSLIRPVAAGQVIRLEHLRITHTVAAGDPVRIQMVGQGFMIQADGQALAGAGDGQPIRVRTESGRILAGTLRGRTVEVRI